MDTYQEQMFEFLSSKENLKGLIIAKNQFSTVRGELILRFWKKIELLLNEAINDKDRWEVILQDDQISSPISKIFISDKNLTIQGTNNLPSFIFCWERLSTSFPFCGFWVNMESKEFNGIKVIEYLSSKKNELAEGYDDRGDWYPFWTRDIIDFSNDDSLLLISNEGFEQKAKEFCEILMTLFNNMETEYDFILRDPQFKN